MPASMRHGWWAYGLGGRGPGLFSFFFSRFSLSVLSLSLLFLFLSPCSLSLCALSLFLSLSLASLSPFLFFFSFLFYPCALSCIFFPPSPLTFEERGRCHILSCETTFFILFPLELGKWHTHFCSRELLPLSIRMLSCYVTPFPPPSLFHNF